MENKKRVYTRVLIGVITIVTLLNIATKVYNNNLKNEISQLERESVIISATNKQLSQEIETLQSPVGKAEDLNWVHQDFDTQFEALVHATWRIETGNGSSDLWIHNNNPGGVKDFYTGEYAVYESKEQGMQELRDLLKTKYVDVYGYDLESIRGVYCQCSEQDIITFMELFIEEGGVLYN